MKRGDLLIELILAVGLFAVLATTAIATAAGLLGLTRTAREREEAGLYLMEGVEAVKAIRDRDWNNLTETTHGLNWDGSKWVFEGNYDQRDKFRRQVTVKAGLRDGNGNLSGSGTEDPDTKKILITVDWQSGPTRNNQVETEFYLTNWREARLGGSGVATIGSCDDACQNSSYTQGNCRVSCQNGETQVNGFQIYCTNQVCCCGN